MDGSIPQKTCSKCGKTYPATSEYFFKDRGRLRARCKTCQREYFKQWRENNIDKVQEQARRYHYENRDKRLAYLKQWHKDNPDYYKSEQQQKYREIHREERLEYLRKWREENADHNKVYHKEHREEIKARKKRWKKENPEYFSNYYKEHRVEARVKDRRRRARLANADGAHTAADVELQVASQTDKNGRLICWWCGKPIKRKYHVDHRIPLSKGGSNDPGNLCITHAKCNLSKNDKMPWEFNGRLL